MSEQTLTKLERQYQQAKARLQAARARERTKARKLDARRKIILGAALIEAATKDPKAAEMLTQLTSRLSRQQDRSAFEGWSIPSPDKGSTQP